MPAVPNTPGNPWLVKGILTLIGISLLGGGVLLFAPGGQIRIGAAPVTADADADVIIQSTAATQVPLVVQGAALQSDNLLELKDSTGTNVLYVGAGGGIVANGGFSGSFTGVSNDLVYYKTLWGGATTPSYSVGFQSGTTNVLDVIGNTGGESATATSIAMKIGASGRIYGNAVANPTPHATASNHTSDGTLITLTTTAAHNLTAGQTITLAGFTWSDGGGAINYTYTVNTTPSTTTFTLAPALTTNGGVCPTTGTNPSVVGTIAVNAQLQLGAAPTRPTTNPVQIGGATQVEGNFSQTTSTGCQLATFSISEELTCATGETTFTSTAHLLPANSFIIGVSTRVTQACAAAETFQVGVAGTTAKFAEALQPKTLGTTTSSWGAGHGGTNGGPAAMLAPFVQAADDHVVVTLSGDPGATALKIRLTVYYQTLTPPTN